MVGERGVSAEEPRFGYPNQNWTVVTNNNHDRGIGQSEVDRESLVHNFGNKSAVVIATQKTSLLRTGGLRASCWWRTVKSGS